MAEQQQIPQQRTPLRKEDYKTKKLLQLIEAKLKTQKVGDKHRLRRIEHAIEPFATRRPMADRKDCLPYLLPSVTNRP